MFKIGYDKKITMVQGDTGVIRMRISNYELSQGDEVRFAIVNKANPSILLCQHSDKKIVLEKQVTVFEKDGSARIVIYPYDTEYLQPGKYLYEIQVVTKDGRTDTVVPLTGLTLMDGSIQGEFGQTTPSKPEPTPSEIELRFKRLENEIIPELGNRITNVENEIDSIMNNNSVNVRDFGAKGDGITDDTEAIKNAYSTAKETNRGLYFPSGIYLVDKMVIDDSMAVGNIFIKGEDKFSTILKLKDKAVIGDFCTMFKFSNLDGEHVDISIQNIGFDMNFRGNPLPEGSGLYDWEHCHAILLYPTSHLGIRNVNIDNLYFNDLIADGISFSGNKNYTFNSVNISNVLSQNRKSTRSDICTTASFNTMNIVNCDLDKLEFETNSTAENCTHIVNINNCIIRDTLDIDINKAGNMSPTVKVNNTQVFSRIYLAYANISFDNCHIKLTETTRLVKGYFKFYNTTFEKGDDFTIVEYKTFLYMADGGTDASVEFVNCDMLMNNNKGTLEYFLYKFHSTEGNKVIFNNCVFNMDFGLINGRSGYYEITNNKFYHDGVNCIIDNTKTDRKNTLILKNNYCFSENGKLVQMPIGSGRLDVFSKNNYTKTLGNVLYFTRFDKITSLRGGTGNIINIIELDDFESDVVPTTGQWIKGQKVYHTNPKDDCIGWVCVANGNANASNFKDLK